MDIPPVKSSYNRNLAASMDRLWRESETHGGELVARSADGLDVFEYASSYEELFELLTRQQIELDDIVIARVPFPNESTLF